MAHRDDRSRRRERRRRRDEIAARAARAWSLGRFETVSDAIEESCAKDASGDRGCASRPGEGRVRLHLRAIAEATLGREGYLSRVAELLGHAAAAMEAIEAPPISARTTLAGRAARGHVEGHDDDRVRLHVRAETAIPIGTLAATLVEAGFDEPTFDAFEARGAASGCGRLHRLRTGRDDVSISVVRCPPAQIVLGAFDLVRGRPVPVLDLESLRARIEAMVAGTDPF